MFDKFKPGPIRQSQHNRLLTFTVILIFNRIKKKQPCGTVIKLEFRVSYKLHHDKSCIIGTSSRLCP